MLGESEGRRPPERQKGGPSGRFLLILVFIGLAGYGGWSYWEYLQPPQPPEPDVQRRAAEIMMFTAVYNVEEYRKARGSLPADISLVSPPKGDWEYVRADTGYTIYLSFPDVVLSYRSGQDYQRLLNGMPPES